MKFGITLTGTYTGDPKALEEVFKDAVRELKEAGAKKVSGGVSADDKGETKVSVNVSDLPDA